MFVPWCHGLAPALCNLNVAIYMGWEASCVIWTDVDVLLVSLALFPGLLWYLLSYKVLYSINEAWILNN